MASAWFPKHAIFNMAAGARSRTRPLVVKAASITLLTIITIAFSTLMVPQEWTPDILSVITLLYNPDTSPPTVHGCETMPPRWLDAHPHAETRPLTCDL